jgi:phosphoribosyl 1,2-cyclic phosphodiesterase
VRSRSALVMRFTRVMDESSGGGFTWECMDSACPDAWEAPEDRLHPVQPSSNTLAATRAMDFMGISSLLHVSLNTI